jgi:predicted phage terminase large subunit-like protein
MPDFELTPRQTEANELLGGDQRHTLLVGGSRSGKTTLLVRAILVRAIRAANTRHAILRFRGNAARASIVLDTLPNVQRKCFPTVKLTEHRQDGYFSLPNGSEIWVGGLDDKERVEKILGQEYISLYFNECSQIPYQSVLVALTRLAQTAQGIKQRAYYDLNPVGKSHWTNHLFGEFRDPVSKRPLPDADNYQRMFLNPKDNADNLSTEYLRSLESLPERQRKRFLEGVYIDELEGALWSLEAIEKNRRTVEDIPENRRRRIVIAVDPSGAANAEDEGADEIGIVVATLGVDGNIYVLADLSLRAGPGEWSRVVAEAYREYRADAVVAERNFGGEMVRYVIQAKNPDIPVRVVTASRGKAVRAEPVATLYDRGVVHHVGRFDTLEDQLCAFTTAGYRGDGSPDHADALVWALTDLALSEETMTFDTAQGDFVIAPIDIPRHWKRVFALEVTHSRVACLWGALEQGSDTVYLCSEYVAKRTDLAVHAAAIRDRGEWVPGVINPLARGRTQEQGARIVERLLAMKLDIFEAETDQDAAIEEMQTRLAGKRLKVFNTLPEWLREYRNYRRDKEGDVVEENDALMVATGMLCLSGIHVATTDIALEAEAKEEWSVASRSSVTGY